MRGTQIATTPKLRFSAIENNKRRNLLAPPIIHLDVATTNQHTSEKRKTA